MSWLSPNRRGFTLVELLVVITIIGTLVALLLPAVQSAREAARRQQCLNNLKQIGLALHNYENTWSRLPSALMGGIPNCNDDGLGWGVAILPFIEQQALYQKVSANGNDGAPCAIVNYYNANKQPIPGGETVLKAYRCPASMLPKVVPPLFALPGASAMLPPEKAEMLGYAINDYKSAGGSCWGDDGVMHKLSEAPNNRRFAEVTDGLSNTLLAGESSMVQGDNTTNPTNVQDWPVWIGGAGQDECVRFIGRTSAPINCGCKPNNMVPAISDDCAFSFHPNGAQFVFCDGSARFISQNIAIQTYCNLNSMNDGQPIGDY
jgi:prepilin-type N-terminal cleavage/methylation domain-containing protein/prepilin-type processing-associated H-X9-DG protein